MVSKSWRNSARPARARPAPVVRPAGSFHAAIERARTVWDGLTGGPGLSGHYSETAAAAIIDAGLRLWGDTAAAMGEEPPAE